MTTARLLPVWERKEALHRRWANSKVADDMTVATFLRFLLTLEATRDHRTVDSLCQAWRKAAKQSTAS
jgi:hypothetical protein